MDEITLDQQIQWIKGLAKQYPMHAAILKSLQSIKQAEPVASVPRALVDDFLAKLDEAMSQSRPATHTFTPKSNHKEQLALWGAVHASRALMLAAP